MKNKLFFKLINAVIAISFLFTNCAWANQFPADKLAAQSQIQNTLREAKLYLSVQALHNGLLNEGIDNLSKLGPRVEGIKNALVHTKRITEEDAEKYKCLVFEDPKTKEKAYYYFNGGRTFFRISTAENVKDSFFNVLGLKKPLEAKEIKVLIRKWDVAELEFDREINYMEVYDNVPEEVQRFIDECLINLYPEDGHEYFNVVDESTLRSAEVDMPTIKLDTKNLSGGNIAKEDEFTQSDFDALREKMRDIRQGLKDDIAKLKAEESRDIVKKSWREWLVPWLSGVKGDVDEEKLLDYEYWLKNNPVINRIIATAEKVRSDKTEAFVHVGIGGSIIPTRAIVNPNISSMINQISEKRRGHSPRVYYTGDSFSPESLMELLDSLEDQGILFKTKYNIISKSGTTAETIGAYLVIRARIQMRLEELKKAYDNGSINDGDLKNLGLTKDDITPVNDEGKLHFKTGRFFIATTGFDTKSVLYKQFHHKGRSEEEIRSLQGDECYKGTDFDPFYAILPVPEGMGGRFSGFSAVGLLLLAVTANTNIGETPRSRIEEAFKGIKQALLRALNTEPDLEENVAFKTAAISHIAEYVKKKVIEVLYFFDPKLTDVAKLLDELYSESLQEGEKGIDVRPLIGTVDNHMAWNGIIAGPRNKIIRFIMTGNYDPASDPFIPEGSGIMGDIQAIEGLRLGSVQNAAVLGTAEDAVWPRRKTKEGEESLPGVLNYTQLLHSRTVANVSDLVFTMMLETAILGKLNGLQKEVKEDGTVVDLTYLQHWVEGYKEAMRKRCQELKLKTDEPKLQGSHLVRKIEEGKNEELLYSFGLDKNGKFDMEEEYTDDKLIGLQNALSRLVHIYGMGILTRIKEIQVVNNLNGENLYSKGRAPLASYKNGILKIDAQALVYNEYVAFEEIEHEFLESIAGLIPGSNEILSDVTSTYWNVQRFLNPNRGVTKNEYKWDVKEYQDAFIGVLESKENPIDPDGEYLSLLKRLRDLQGEIKEDDVIALVVIYVFRTKLYETVRDKLGIPEDLAGKIKAIDLKKGDALTVFNEIAKAKQGGKLVSDIRDSKELTIKVIKTFSETVRIKGLEELSKRLAEIIAGAVKAASRMEEVAGIAQAKTEGKYCIVIDKNRIPDGMQDKWDNEIKRLEKSNVYKVVYSLDEALRDYRPENIIYLLDPADIREEKEMKKGILYLPMPYLRSSLYMAAVVVAGGGDIQKIDPLVTGLIMDLYKQILARDNITAVDLKNLFTAPWRILPEIINVLGDINNLRRTLVEIEKAA